MPFPLTRPDRVLTGADFDVESIVKAARRLVLDRRRVRPVPAALRPGRAPAAAPSPLPGVFAPGEPGRGSAPRTWAAARASRAWPLARRPHLYPLLEGTVTGDAAGHAAHQRVRPRTRARTPARAGPTGWTARPTPSATPSRSTAPFPGHRAGQRQGDAAAFKRIYLADLRDRDRDGLLDKTLVADLLNIANPQQLGGFGDGSASRSRPSRTWSSSTTGPSACSTTTTSRSRRAAPGRPDNNEFITIRLDRRLGVDRRIA